jgi:hypothetical protein
MHSVPSGSPITDHVRTDPITFQLVGVLTPYNVARNNIPFDLEDPFAAAFDDADDQADASLELTRRNRDQLLQYADERTLLTIVGDEINLPNMVITSIDDPKTSTLGDSFELTMSFRQIRVPTNAARIAPIISDDAEALGGGQFVHSSRAGL